MVQVYRLRTMRVVYFMMTMVTYAAANAGQRGALCKYPETLNQMDEMRPSDISNRVRRNAPEILNVPEIHESDENTRRNLMQNNLLRVPSRDIINSLTSGRTKRSYIDYDSSEDQENIDPKKQLEQISSRNFASDSYNKEQRRKLFFSQLFSMIDGSINSKKSRTDFENDDLLISNESADIGELFSESPNQITDKRSHSNTDLEKKIYVPVRKTKRRRQAQDSVAFPNNLKGEKKVNIRPERQLGEIINDDNVDTQFYKDSKYAPITSQDYESIEKPMEEQLPNGPTGDDIIETSPVYLLPTTTNTSVYQDSVEKLHYNSNVTNFSPSTLVSQTIQHVKPEINDLTEQERIPTQYTFNTFEHSTEPKNVSFKNKVTEPSSITKSYSSNAHQSNGGIVKKVLEPINTVTDNADSKFMITNSPAKDTNEKNQSPYTNTAIKNRIDSDKIQSRRANENLEDKYVKPEKIEDVSKIQQEKIGQTQDVKVANVYGESDIRLNRSKVVVNPLSARIKLDFLIELQDINIPIARNGFIEQ